MRSPVAEWIIEGTAEGGVMRTGRITKRGEIPTYLPACLLAYLPR